MVVGQQKLKGLLFQTNLNTNSISKRICGENTAPPVHRIQRTFEAL